MVHRNNISVNYDDAGIHVAINKNEPALPEQMQRALSESGDSKELQGPVPPTLMAKKKRTELNS